MDITRYTTILQLPQEFKLSGVKQYIPTPIESDYKRGYIVRYFTQKVNDINSPVYEIDDYTFSNLSNNSFYQICSLDWKIIGTDEEIKEANMKSVKRAGKVLPAVQLYLPYLLQFKKS
jgi:hypothetical protein